MYDNTTLNDLPVELNPTTLSKVGTYNSMVFGGVHSEFNYLGNFFPCVIKHDQKIFSSVEQAYIIMIKLYNDHTTAEKIKLSKSPQDAVKLSRTI